jgi:hypothetical protein
MVTFVQIPSTQKSRPGQPNARGSRSALLALYSFVMSFRLDGDESQPVVRVKKLVMVVATSLRGKTTLLDFILEFQ